MEDILASIRRIIADDQSRQSGSPGARQAPRTPSGGTGPGTPPPPALPAPASAAVPETRPAATPAAMTPPEPGSRRAPVPAPMPPRTLPPLTARVGGAVMNGGTPHVNPPPATGDDLSVFEEIASAGAASARTDLPVPPPAATGSSPSGSPSAAAPAVADSQPIILPAEPEASHQAPPGRSGAATATAAGPNGMAGPDAPAGDDHASAPPDRPAEPLVSAAAFSAIEQSFQALSASLVMQNNGQLDVAVRDLLRPMLKSWLDDNLPAIVERLVRAEIERVARGGKA